jgi:hypothetical protein
MEWKDGHLDRCVIEAGNPMKRVIRYGDIADEIMLASGKTEWNPVRC